MHKIASQGTKLHTKIINAKISLAALGLKATTQRNFVVIRQKKTAPRWARRNYLSYFHHDAQFHLLKTLQSLSATSSLLLICKENSLNFLIRNASKQRWNPLRTLIYSWVNNGEILDQTQLLIMLRESMFAFLLVCLGRASSGKNSLHLRQVTVEHWKQQAQRRSQKQITH